MERELEISYKNIRIPCKIYTPDVGNVKRVMIGVHGFCMHKDVEIHTGLAEEMQMYGGATVCFDFPAHGESTASDWDFTVDNCVGCLIAVAEMVQENFEPEQPVGIFASGFGAYITLLALEQIQSILGQPRLVIQTPSVRMAETILALKGITREYFETVGRIRYGLNRKVEIPYKFYEELRQNSVMNSYDCPMLILHGDEDSYIQMADIQNFRRINEGSKLVIIPGAAHRFLKAGEWDMVLDLTRDWFMYEQVLLSDWE